MILDLLRFRQAGKPHMHELQTVVREIEAEPERRMPLTGRIKAEVTAEYLEIKRRQVL